MSEILKAIESFAKLLSSIPSILGAIGALICYRYLSDDWWWIVITYLVILAIGKSSVTLWRAFWQWQSRKQDIAYYTTTAKEREAREKQNTLDDVKVFFLTLSEQNLNKLIAIYNTSGDSTGYYNERIIPTDDLLVHTYAREIVELESMKLTNEERYITSKSDLYSYSPLHIWFHPHLYAILKNYIESGIKDYPKDYLNGKK